MVQLMQPLACVYPVTMCLSIYSVTALQDGNAAESPHRRRLPASVLLAQQRKPSTTGQCGHQLVAACVKAVWGG
jgi:hypothetical protein